MHAEPAFPFRETPAKACLARIFTGHCAANPSEYLRLSTFLFDGTCGAVRVETHYEKKLALHMSSYKTETLSVMKLDRVLPA